MVINAMEDVDVSLGTNGHGKKLKASGLFEFLLVSKNLPAPLKAPHQ